MRFGKGILCAASGLALATLVAAVIPEGDAQARRRRSGRVRLKSINVDGSTGVPLNAIIEFRFTHVISPASANHALFQIRAENDNSTGFTKQVPGSFQIRGTNVAFFPRIATHLRDPDRSDGSFYAEGTANDDANVNSALQPDTMYEIRVLGHPSATPVRARNGRRLNRSASARFSTESLNGRYTTLTYQDNPPPRFVLSNPADKAASVADQYAKHGGGKEVESAARLSLFATQVPLDATSSASGRQPLTDDDRTQRRYVDPSAGQSLRVS